MKNYYFVTFVTWNSRVSERMIHFKVKRPDYTLWLSPAEEVKLCNIFRDIVLENKYEIYAFNICGDHVHMVLCCQSGDLKKIMAKLKGKSALVYNSGTRPAVAEYADGTHQKLWAKKYHAKLIETEEQLHNAMNYGL